MLKKWIAIVCICVMVVSLAGCGGTKSNTKAAGFEENVTISIMWQQEGFEGSWELPLQQFKEKYPEVTVEFESNPNACEIIRNLLNVQEAPDIFFTWVSEVDYYDFAKKGLLSPVDDILKEENAEGTATLGETLFQQGVKAGEIDGQHYFLPTDKFLAGNMYSGKLFKDNDWQVPRTWTEFENTAKLIHDSGMPTIIYSGIYPYLFTDAFIAPMIYNIDPAAMADIDANKPGAWKAPAVKETINRLQQLVEAGYIDKNSLAMDHIQSEMDFANNKAAFVPVGNWIEGELAGQWADDFDIQPMFTPGEVADKTATVSVVEYLVLPKQKEEDSRKAKYIKELLRMYYSQENAKYSAEKTGYLLALEEPNSEVIQALPESAQRGWDLREEHGVEVIAPSYKIKYKEILIEVSNCINALVQGQIDADGFCERVDKVAQEIGEK